MKNFILAILFILIISCSNNTISKKFDTTYNTIQKDDFEVTKSIDHTQWNALLSKYVSKDGKVNYKGFKKDEKALQHYLEILQKNTPLNSWTKNEKLAYWINAYNAFTIRLILDHYPVKSIKDIRDPWGKEFITIGKNTYSLEDIEHKILRKMNEPRIHFAINCASYSCPNLSNKAYTQENLEQQLEAAAKHFVNDASKNSISKETIEISKIFNWFSSDFKKYGTIIAFLNTYSTVKIDSNAKIKYKSYNWNLTYSLRILYV
jgi:hypothetical protein